MVLCKFKSFVSLPDISKRNASNVKNMSNMFYEYNYLILLPDISKWDISKLIDISYMFYNCYSLQSFSDLFKLVNKNIRMIDAFKGCEQIKEIPKKI